MEEDCGVPRRGWGGKLNEETRGGEKTLSGEKGAGSEMQCFGMGGKKGRRCTLLNGVKGCPKRAAEGDTKRGSRGVDHRQPNLKIEGPG